MSDMVLWQRVEGFGVFLGGVAVLLLLPEADLVWWALLLLFFAPDLSFAAYLAGPRLGAAIYNLAHTYAVPTLLIALGLWGDLAMSVTLGCLWLAHTGLDRALGYGLKSTEGFTTTHLGKIGKDA